MKLQKLDDDIFTNIIVALIVVTGICALLIIGGLFQYFMWYLYIHDIVKYLHFPYIPFWQFVGIFWFVVWILNVIKHNLFPNKEEAKK